MIGLNFKNDVIDYIRKRHQQQNSIFLGELMAAILLTVLSVSLLLMLIFLTDDGSSYFYNHVLRLYENRIWGIARFFWLVSLIIALKLMTKFTVWFLQALILWVQAIKRNQKQAWFHLSEALAFIILVAIVLGAITALTHHLMQEDEISFLMRFSEYEIVDLAGEFLTTLLMVALLIYILQSIYYLLLYLILLLNSVFVSRLAFEPLKLPRGRHVLMKKTDSD